MDTTTAVRTGATLTVTFPDGTTATTTGKRAASAAAVSIGRWDSDGRWTYGVHASAAAAAARARTYSTPPARGGGYWLDAAVVPVTDADPAAEVRRARRITCEPHGGSFKAQFGAVVFRCGRGCEEARPEWRQDHGWAIHAD